MRHSKMNLGVEDAPDYILTPEFLSRFSEKVVSEFNFSKPETVEKENYYQVLSQELKLFKDLINKDINPDHTQVVIGGDNSVTFSSFLAVVERNSSIEQIGYLQFDSHGEMHLLSTSISKNFHGMYMRPFFDKFDVLEIEELVPNKLSLGQVLTIGDIIFEEDHPRGEAAFHKNIKNINRNEYINNRTRILAEISEFLSKYDHIHIK